MSQRKTPHSRRYLFFTVFVSGMSTLAVEFTASRMLQAVYGTSNIVWCNVIGLVLFFLTAGYFLGGWLADRYSSHRLFYLLVTGAGASSIFFLLLTSSILRSAATALAQIDIGGIVGSLMAVALALAAPVTLLGCVSPFAVRLGVREVAEAGRISGRLYALSTWGSLMGTYLPVLWVIPVAGSRLSALIFGSLQLAVGLGGLWQVSRRTSAVAAAFSFLLLSPAVVLLLRGGIKNRPGQLFETESAYNYIEVVRQGGCNYLLLNEGAAYHSYYCDGGEAPDVSVWSILLAAPFFAEPRPGGATVTVRRVAVVGLAAGTTANLLTRVFGPITIDGIEIDPAIVSVGRRFFAMNEPNLNVVVGDGRYQLRRLPGRYDLITVDAYRVPYIPWHLTTQEFFREAAGQLTDRGVLAINVGRAPGDRRLVDAVSATLTKVFPTVHAVDVPGSGNTILVATKRATSVANLSVNRSRLSERDDPILISALGTAEASLVPLHPSSIVFTDERAPVETLVDALVLRYLIGGAPGAEDGGFLASP